MLQKLRRESLQVNPSVMRAAMTSVNNPTPLFDLWPEAKEKNTGFDRENFENQARYCDILSIIKLLFFSTGTFMTMRLGVGLLLGCYICLPPFGLSFDYRLVLSHSLLFTAAWYILLLQPRNWFTSRRLIRCVLWAVFSLLALWLVLNRPSSNWGNSEGLVVKCL